MNVQVYWWGNQLNKTRQVVCTTKGAGQGGRGGEVRLHKAMLPVNSLAVWKCYKCINYM